MVEKRIKSSKRKSSASKNFTLPINDLSDEVASWVENEERREMKRVTKKAKVALNVSTTTLRIVASVHNLRLDANGRRVIEMDLMEGDSEKVFVE